MARHARDDARAMPQLAYCAPFPAPDRARTMTAHDIAADTALPCHADLLRELFARQEAERKHIARALHNEIGQAVSAIKMSAHLAADENDAEQRSEDLREIVRIADDTVARLRDLYSLLRPPQIDSLGLEASLRAESERWRARWNLDAELSATDMSSRPPPATELAAFRLVQDLLDAQATLTRISVCVEIGHPLTLIVEHDGTAPDALTLAMLHARVHALGGSLHLQSDASGVQLQATLPAQVDAHRTQAP